MMEPRSSAGQQVTVATLIRYPVKSMRGEEITSVGLGKRGITGDREWAVTFADGKIGSGRSWRHVRRLDGLLGYTARIRQGYVEVVTPEGDVRRAGDSDLDDDLSRRAHERVRVARESVTPHLDVAPIHLIGTSELQRLAGVLPDPELASVNRFRPNMVVDDSAAPGFLSSRIGSNVGIGSNAVLHLTEPTERCLMVTLPQLDVTASKAVLRVLAAEFGTCLGVYARIIRPGPVRSGDQVRDVATA